MRTVMSSGRPNRASNLFVRLATAALLVSAGVLLASPAAGGATPVAPAVTRYRAGIPGIVDPGPAAAMTSPQPASVAGQAAPKGVRRTSPTRGVAVDAAPSFTPVGPRAGASLRHDWNGVSSLDSAVTNFGAEFQPPDQGLCVGNGFVIEAVNSAYRVERTDGSVLVGPSNVNDLFNVGGDEYTSDPRCYYDAPTHTWFATILFINKASTEASVDIAVNGSGDPTTPWVQYQLDTTDAGGSGAPNHPGCPCLGDQPLLGIDQTNLYISTNEFSILGPEFNGAQIYAITKAELIQSRPAHFVHFEKLTIGGALAATVQPAVSAGGPAAEYFMSSLDPNGTSDRRIGVWAMTQVGAVASGHSPVLSSTVLTSEPYSVPPPAPQQGSSRPLDSGDDRMQQVEFIGGSLWGALGTGITLPGDPVERAGAAWFRVLPSVSGVLIGTTAIDQEGYVGESGSSILYPAIQADAQGRTAMVFTLTGPRNFPSSAYTFAGVGQTVFGAIRTTAHGTGPYVTASGSRWGDYSFAALDASTGLFWLATEYIPSTRSQTPDGLKNWGTRVVAVSLR
jgi:hypothetical protein